MNAPAILGAIAAIGCGAFVLTSCNNASSGEGETTGGSAPSNLTGSIRADGSSTIYPITQALAEMFMDKNSGVRVTVAFSGTGGGFKKLISGEIQIAGASRPIEQSEFDQLKEKNTEFLELPVAFDGLTVVVNPKNTWVDHLTTAELQKIWESGSTVKTWRDVRPTWPDKPIKLFGPGTDSGTFDYFTEAICGKKGNSRADYTQSEDDNQLVIGVAGEEAALGYFGFAYYEESMDMLKVVPVDGGQGPITPSSTTIKDGTYQPLSRPLFLYVVKSAIEKPETKALVDYFFSNTDTIVQTAKYIPLEDAEYETVKKIVADLAVGTRFMGAASGTHIREVLAAEPKK